METFAFHLMPYQDIEEIDEEHAAWPWAEYEYDPEKGAQYYDDYLGQLEYAADLGFDGVAVNEHHYNAYGLQPSPNITASNLAGRTEDTTIAFFGNLPALRENPIRLAEELAMLDNITEGRIISGFPRGIPSEYLAYGIPMEESRSRFEEAWDLIVKAWTADEPFDWDGKHFQYEQVNIWPRPYQDPHPQLWMPAESEESLRFAAERQIPTGLVFQPIETIAEKFDEYRQYADEYDWTPGDEHFSTMRAIYVAESMEKAREEAEQHLRKFYKTLTAGVHIGVTAGMMGDQPWAPDKWDTYVDELHPHGELAYNYDFEKFQDYGETIVGTPEYVVEELKRQYDVVDGFGRIVGQFHFGDLPDWKMRKSLKLYAEEVKPEVDEIGDVNPNE
ncbi:LLM class flavin-dependent oxidoreductase [Halomarina pelagica]|uniref:LLM class flavin-dependent oxidoreductase n=1 Tax=Halomarina pelagica TaxID=2961599 RepID=UPI0020C40346|nr:LLM class flavin-dependent oxidoreductase [Halomarina sp. BND7]